MTTQPPTLPQVDVGASSSFNPDFSSTSITNGHSTDQQDIQSSTELSHAPATQPLDSQKQQDAPDPKTQKEVQEVLYSDVW